MTVLAAVISGEPQWVAPPGCASTAVRHRTEVSGRPRTVDCPVCWASPAYIAQSARAEAAKRLSATVVIVPFMACSPFPHSGDSELEIARISRLGARHRRGDLKS